MLLNSPDGTSFELRILGYEFPAISDTSDANWLNVQITVRSNIAHWKKVHPCILTMEVPWLITWFEDLVEGNYPDQPCEFMEPNLSFECIGTRFGPTVRVYFRLECRPDGFPSKDLCSDELFLDFPVAHLDLAAIIADLRKYAESFPQRGRM